MYYIVKDLPYSSVFVNTLNHEISWSHDFKEIPSFDTKEEAETALHHAKDTSRPNYLGDESYIMVLKYETPALPLYE